MALITESDGIANPAAATTPIRAGAARTSPITLAIGIAALQIEGNASGA